MGRTSQNQRSPPPPLLPSANICQKVSIQHVELNFAPFRAWLISPFPTLQAFSPPTIAPSAFTPPDTTRSERREHAPRTRGLGFPQSTRLVRQACALGVRAPGESADTCKSVSSCAGRGECFFLPSSVQVKLA